MRKIGLIFTVLLVAVIMSACIESTSALRQKIYSDNIAIREEIFAIAQALYPIPIPSDFPLRKDLVEFTLREAKPGPWYIYIQTDAGTYTAYYVAKNKPQNSCNFLSETKTTFNNVVRDAPSLDGIYYGGTGASGACDAWFWFDAGTNALVESRFKFTVSDQALAIDVPEIKVKISGK